MKKRKRVNRHRAESLRKPKEAKQVPPLPTGHKESVVSIILRDWATTFRRLFPRTRIEAHPKDEKEASLHVTVDKRHKLLVTLRSLEDTLTVMTRWTVAGDQHKQVPFSLARSLGPLGMDLVNISNESSHKVSILEPDSLQRLEKWVNIRILTLAKHVDSLDNN